jgi:hypothetical protein
MWSELVGFVNKLPSCIMYMCNYEDQMKENYMVKACALLQEENISRVLVAKPGRKRLCEK